MVSILIPAYNAEKWIADTIRSALSQTWPKKEIIIVNDGSTDQTLAIANRFASRIVSVYDQANQGGQVTRNRAFSLCQGDYIQWLDADDLLAPDKIARQMMAMRDGDTKRTLFSGAWGGFLYRVQKAKFSPSPLWCDLSPAEWLIRKMESGSHMPNSTWLVSRELTELAGPWDTRLRVDQDGEYFCRVKLASDGIRFVPEATAYYRRTDGSRVSVVGASRLKQESVLLSMQLVAKYVLSLEDSERSRAACVKYLQKRMIDIHPENADIAAQMQQLASTLGGQVEFPRSPSRYAWIQKLFGWKVAERTRLSVRSVRTRLMKSIDKTLFRLQRSPMHPWNALDKHPSDPKSQ